MGLQTESSFCLTAGEEKQLSCRHFAPEVNWSLAMGYPSLVQRKGGYDLLALVTPNGGERCSKKVAAGSR